VAVPATESREARWATESRRLLVLRQEPGRGSQAGIDLCNDIIAEEVELEGPVSRVASLNTPTWCRVCRLPKSAEEVVAVSELGFFCRRCIDMIRAATDESAAR